VVSAEGRFQPQKIGEKHYKLDVCGLVCPYPQLLAARTLSNLSFDDVLEVILDNPPSVRDIPPALEERGYKVLDVSRLDGSTWKIMVQTKKQ